jgi:hypothetical protein
MENKAGKPRTSPYTDKPSNDPDGKEDALQARLLAKWENGKKQSLRSIAAEFGRPITHGDIERAIHGKFPTRLDKRMALGLPLICPVCLQTVKRPHRHVSPELKKAVEILRRLELQAGSRPVGNRVYNRQGKQVPEGDHQ